MIKIKVFSAFCSSENCKFAYDNIYGVFKDFTFTVDNDYTHAILINNAMPKLNIPKENVLGMSFEPICNLQVNDKFINYVIQNVNEYYVPDKGNLPNPFKTHYAFLWHNWRKNWSNIPFEKKPYKMSIIVSEKRILPGHQYRHELVNKILNSDMDIHIFGRGSRKYGYDPRIKGSFNEDNVPYKDYKYTIAIENSLTSAHITEKITNPLSVNTIPIYYGGTDVVKYFDKEPYRLTGNIDNDFKLITDIYENIEKYKMDIKVMRYNLFHGKAYFPKFIMDYWQCNEKKLREMDYISSYSKFFQN